MAADCAQEPCSGGEGTVRTGRIQARQGLADGSGENLGQAPALLARVLAQLFQDARVERDANGTSGLVTASDHGHSWNIGMRAGGAGQAPVLRAFSGPGSSTPTPGPT